MTGATGGLRAELGGETMPEFTLSLPVGWVRRTPDEATHDELVAAARARLMRLHRPDLFGQLSALTDRLFRDLRRTGAVAFFLPGEGAPDAAFLPASLTASVRRGPDGRSLDDTMAQLIRAEGATPLGGDRRFLRWLRSERRPVDAGDATAVDTTTVVYLTPVPRTGRRRALQFTLVISHDAAADGDAEYVAALVALFDAHLATFAWAAA